MSLEEVISSKATVALGTVPAVGTVHSAFEFSEQRCFQLEGPDRSHKDLWVGRQLTSPSFNDPSPILSPRMTAAPRRMHTDGAASPLLVSIPGELSILSFLAERWKDKIIASYSFQQE